MSHALLGAMRKGLAAKVAGLARDTCPYEDTRKVDGRLTWSRSFRRAWFYGYEGKFTDQEKAALRPFAELLGITL